MNNYNINLTNRAFASTYSFLNSRKTEWDILLFATYLTHTEIDESLQSLKFMVDYENNLFSKTSYIRVVREVKRLSTEYSYKISKEICRFFKSKQTFKETQKIFTKRAELVGAVRNRFS